MPKETEKIIVAYKELGETPLQSIDRVKNTHPEYKDIKISYAGRLDPMAEGVLLLVIGDENKNKDKYLNLDKEYTFDVLFGFETDTFDILGKVIKISNEKVEIENIGKLLETFLGESEQEYPPFSSKTVNGKPLFEWAREDRLNEINIPRNKINIFEIKLLKTEEISKENLKENIFSKIKLIKNHDFRQDEIIKHWNNAFNKCTSDNFVIATIKIKCSSGTYVRRLAHELGKKLNIPTTTFHILRNKIGEYGI